MRIFKISIVAVVTALAFNASAAGLSPCGSVLKLGLKQNTVAPKITDKKVSSKPSGGET